MSSKGMIEYLKTGAEPQRQVPTERSAAKGIIGTSLKAGCYSSPATSGHLNGGLTAVAGSPDWGIVSTVLYGHNVSDYHSVLLGV